MMMTTRPDKISQKALLDVLVGRYDETDLRRLSFLETERDQITAWGANLAAWEAQQEALKAQIQQVTQALDAQVG